MDIIGNSFDKSYYTLRRECISYFFFNSFLDDIDGDVTLFIVYCFVFRIFLAIGCTASATASFAVTAMVFPDNVATVFGLLETATGLGMMVGPALGGVLYQVMASAATAEADKLLTILSLLVQ